VDRAANAGRQPDIQGLNNQGRRLATYDIEAAADPVRVP
jgi:hypothetical protein